MTVPLATVAVLVVAVLVPALGGPTAAYAIPPPPMAVDASRTFATVHFVNRM
jgi:hypothetical protein